MKKFAFSLETLEKTLYNNQVTFKQIFQRSCYELRKTTFVD